MNHRGQSVTTDDRRTFTNVLGADKDKLHRNQTLGNSNKDAMFDYRSGFYQSGQKRNCHIYVNFVMIFSYVSLKT